MRSEDTVEDAFFAIVMLPRVKAHLNDLSHLTTHFTSGLMQAGRATGHLLYCRSVPRCGAQKPSVARVSAIPGAVHAPIPWS